MPGSASMDASLHRFEFVGEFKKNPQGVKGEMAVAQFLFECPLNGVTDDASRAIKNLLGKTVTIKVCSTEYNRYSAVLGQQIADKQRRAAAAEKEDVKAEALPFELLPIGDYLHPDGHRFTIEEGEDEENGRYWKHVCIPAEGAETPSVAMDDTLCKAPNFARINLKDWGEKHGYEMVPPIGYGRVYEHKAGLAKLAWNVTTDTYQGFVAISSDEAGFIQELAGGWGIGHEEDAQADLDKWAAKKSLPLAGYISFAEIAPLPAQVPVESDEETKISVVYKDAEGFRYSVDRSPSGSCFCIFKKKEGEADAMITLSNEDGIDYTAAVDRLTAMASEHDWKLVEFACEDVAPEEAESDREDASMEDEVAEIDAAAEAGEHEDAEEAGDQAESDSGESEEAEQKTEGHPMPDCIHAGVGIGCKKRNGKECGGETCQDYATEQPAEETSKQAEEPAAEETPAQECDKNGDCAGCEKDECPARTDEYDPFREVPEHPESPNAQQEPEPEAQPEEPSTDGEETLVQKLQAMFKAGAGAGGPKIQIKDEFKLAGARGGPVNVMRVEDDGSAVMILGKGPIKAEIVNEKYFLVE